MNWTIDHVARVVPDLKRYLERSYLPEPGEVIYDPLQDAEICFIDLGENQPRIELIVPRSSDSRVYAAAQQQPNALHHLGYRAESVEEAQKVMREHRLIPVYGPVPAVAFGGLPVLFAYSRNRELLEFVCKPQRFE